MSVLQAIIFGIIQGVTEPFPVSSLGHSVLLPTVLGWSINQSDPFFLIFLVALHLATALVFFLMFWKDWVRIIQGIWKKGAYGRLFWLLVIGTIPAGVIGLLFENKLAALFAAPMIVAFILILNGLLLFAADAIYKRNDRMNKVGIESDERIARLRWSQALKIGFLQCLALIPGFSRTGATLSGGLLSGLSYEDAARFSFLLATPIIGAAALLKLPKLLMEQSPGFSVMTILAGALAAAIAAYLSVKILLKYFETKKLWPFGIYCIVVGILFLLFAV